MARDAQFRGHRADDHVHILRIGSGRIKSRSKDQLTNPYTVGPAEFLAGPRRSFFLLKGPTWKNLFRPRAKAPPEIESPFLQNIRLIAHPFQRQHGNHFGFSTTASPRHLDIRIISTLSIAIFVIKRALFK